MEPRIAGQALSPHPASNMPKRKRPKPSAERKISETFLEFLEPLLVVLGPTATAEEIEPTLRIGFMVWNSVVFEDQRGDPEVMQRMRGLLAGNPRLAQEGVLIEHLIARKRELFADDPRLIGDYKLSREGELWKIRVEARGSTGGE